MTSLGVYVKCGQHREVSKNTSPLVTTVLQLIENLKTRKERSEGKTGV